MTNWIADAVGIATTVGSNGGSLINALTVTGSSERERMANLLVAATMSEHSEEAREYVRSFASQTSGTPGTPVSVVVSDDDRPTYLRPNGSMYYARKWNGMWDVDVLRKARETGQFVLLLGSPGTGKTAMVEAAWDDLITTVVTGDTMVSGLVGGFVPDGTGSYRWADGPLLTAVREGRPILIDEILLANPVVLSVLYPLMDGRGFLDVQENPDIGVVQAKEGFFILGAANPNVPGAKLSEALGSRFPLHVEVTTDWELAKRLGVDSTVVQVAEGLSRSAAGTSSSISWSPQMRELLAFQSISDTFGRAFALRNLMALCPKADLTEVTTRVAPLLGGMDAVIPSKV